MADRFDGRRSLDRFCFNPRNPFARLVATSFGAEAPQLRAVLSNKGQAALDTDAGCWSVFGRRYSSGL
jgi:hypothetical protein